MMIETVPLLAFLIMLGWPMVERRPALKKFLLWSGIVAIVHHLVGTFTYDTISPFNPLKPDWHIGEDFIALYVREFGLAALVRNTALYGGLLAGVLAVGGYYVSRFFLPDEQSTQRLELEATID